MNPVSSRAGTGDSIATLVDALDATVREAVAKAAATTNGGRDIDAHLEEFGISQDFSF
jgi:hypothetical protein